MTVLVLMLANGWMTRFKKYDIDDAMEIYAPLFLLIILVHCLFGVLTYVDQDAHHKYLNFEGWIAHGLIIVKLILVVIFLYYHINCKD